MVTAFVYYGLERRQGVGAVEVVEGANEHRSVLAGTAAYALGHLLRGLELHVHEAGAGLHGLYQPALRHLRAHILRNPAGGHERDVAGEELLDLGKRQFTEVQTYLGHLAIVEGLPYLFGILMLKYGTNHCISLI